MKKLSLFALALVLSPPALSIAQSLPSQVQTMKGSYAASGSIVLADNQTLVIEPNMPGPICAMPKNENGKVSWMYYSFPLASITVPLAAVDQDLIGEDTVFTNDDAIKAYKPGDVGDATMVVIAGVPGKQFHTLTYDRDKLIHLPPGPHSSASYAQAPDDVEAFGLTFADRAAAHAFVSALRNAVLLAKAHAANR
jgi:hypothetical protein